MLWAAVSRTTVARRISRLRRGGGSLILGGLRLFTLRQTTSPPKIVLESFYHKVYYGRMRFGEFQSDLDQSTLDLLAGVFDRSWAALQAANGEGIADEVAARDMLGRRIIAAAIELGAREPEKLKNMALEGMIQ